MSGIPAAQVRIEDIRPCPGSGKRWDQPRLPSPGKRKMCPDCDAGVVALRVPDDEPAVPAHPDMTVWGSRVDVVLWRQLRPSS